MNPLAGPSGGQPQLALVGLPAEGPCTLAPGGLSGGYAWTRHYGERVLAHRAAWERVYGPIPDGMYVLHRCDVRNCIEPSHLFLGTNADNMADMVAKGRHAEQRKTHCPQGHEYSVENTLWASRPNGRRARYCRICHRAVHDRWKAARREALAELFGG